MTISKSLHVLFLYAGIVVLAGCDGPGEVPGEPVAEIAHSPAAPPPATGPLLAYRGATLIDGTGADPLEGATVLVQGPRIVRVGAELDVPEGTEVVDVSGKWIVPGLIDAHVHFMTSGRSYTRPAMMDLQHVVSYEEEIEWIEGHIPDTLRSMLCAGVTGVVSMGGPSIEYRAREQAREMRDAPTVLIGHGVAVPIPTFLAERFFPRWRGELTLKPVTSPEEGMAFAREAAVKQADLIKAAVDDRGSFLFSLLMKMVGWESILEAIIEEAAGNGQKVTSHIHQLEPARKLVELGVDSLQHLPSDEPVDEGFLALARESEVIVVPTLAIHDRTFDELYTKEFDFLPIEQTCGIPDVIQSWYEELPPRDGDSSYLALQKELANANTRQLHQAGVSLAVGTDAGLMGLLHGPSMHLELRAMHEAGLSAPDLIVAATLNSARTTGREKDYGSVEAGKFADFLVLSKNPLDDIANMQAIQTVVKHGEVFSQDELLPRPAHP